MRWIVAILLLIASVVASAEYPARPIRGIVAYPPGGGTDIIARMLAKELPFPIVIDNRSGASGMIGTDIANGARADGYTILIGHITPNAINPGEFFDPPVTPKWNLDSVALTGTSPSLLLVSPSVSASSASSVLSWMRQKRPAYASDGLGSLAHLQMEFFLSGLKLTHVPYKGGGPAIVGLLTNEVSVMFSPAPVAIQWVTSGKIKVIAQTSKRRSTALPSTPTMAESGINGFEAPLWWGVFVPAGAPKHVIETLNREINSVIKKKPVQDWGITQAITFEPATVQSFDDLVKSERLRWGKIIKEIR